MKISPHVLFNKIHKKGLLWFFNRLKIEIRNPTKQSSKQLIDFALGARKKIFKFFKKAKHDELLYLIYDLEICDITYSFVMMLVDAEFEAKKQRKKGFVVVVVPRSTALRPDLSFVEYDSVIDDHSKLWRLQNIIMPLIPLSPFCRGLYFLPRRDDVFDLIKNHDVYPYLYDGVNLRAPSDPVLRYKKLDQPNLVEGLRALPQGLRYVQDWLQMNKIQLPVVTITIRSSLYDKGRNSNIDAWSKFATYLLVSGYHAVIIPDTDNAFVKESAFEDASIFRECSWNIGLRAAIYETAFLNFFVPNGCADLAVFNPTASYICMNMLPANSIITTEEAYKAVGHVIGEDYKFATDKQRLCFKPDSFENIKHEFDQFVSHYPPS
ncbi:hypothetical protein [Synechococcus sp. MIT S9508]|uniref:hypothetical protein n=1 Tax=Synechococcus sp. MIT S9508 TaxID=1801629 RepID=UPI0007BB8DDD|nr:hypothetical protein [Synechococcus sp. MIT S9508]KZR90575.1 hypothetical protein MITS9508_00576 [Synechococcus sp. MIT S9508]